jgi:hypothetical protein
LITERVGGALRDEAQSQTERFLAGQTPTGSGPRAALLVVSVDGGRVQTRQDDPKEKWKEDKVGVVYDARPCPERPGVAYEGPSPRTRSVRATMESWQTLGDRLSALADARGYARARQRVCICFQTDRAAMNYPAFRKNGWPIGSGIIESVIKQTGQRVKGTEKHWSISGVEQTLQAIAHLISNDAAWDDFWKRCPSPQQRRR